MSCLDDNLALALIDGKLPPPRRAEVESHIESCAMCRELIVMLARGEGGDHEGGPTDSQVGLETQASSRREGKQNDGKHSGRPTGGEGGRVDTNLAPPITAIRKAGPYKIEREVGSGSAGTVYRAVDERNGEVVALKYVTDPAWRSRFRREVETLKRLMHPGIVRYVSDGDTRQGLYLAMEWLDGEDLAHYLDRGPIPWPGVRSLGLRLVAALAHAHSVDAVHRDIGPRNIFLPASRLEHAKLLDFGLVRVPDATDKTASQAVLGTPQYMAPEQVRDPRTVDARSDIFSLGVVFFEALSGQRPFDASDLFTVWNKIVGAPTPNLRELVPTVPEGFVTLIERMLEKNPASRPQNAAAVHEALVRLDAPASGNTSTAVRPPIAMSAAGFPNTPMPMVSPTGPTIAQQGSEVSSTAKLPPPPAPVKSTAKLAAPNAPASSPSPSQPIVMSTPPSNGMGPHGASYPIYAKSQSPISNQPAAAPPSMRNTGVIIVASTFVASAIIIAAIAIVVGPRLLDRPKTEPTDTTTEPVSRGVKTKTTDKAPVPAPAPEPDPEPESGPSRADGHFACTGDSVHKGETYDSDGAGIAVVVNGSGCHITLEDCVINGPAPGSAIMLNGSPHLTLRRCKVTGTTSTNGPVTLELEGTKLPSKPRMNGGRLVQR